MIDSMRNAHNNGEHDESPPAYGECAQCDYAQDGENVPNNLYEVAD